jgi:hypothetical protein
VYRSSVWQQASLTLQRREDRRRNSCHHNGITGYTPNTGTKPSPAGHLPQAQGSENNLEYKLNEIVVSNGAAVHLAGDP